MDINYRRRNSISIEPADSAYYGSPPTDTGTSFHKKNSICSENDHSDTCHDSTYGSMPKENVWTRSRENALKVPNRPLTENKKPKPNLVGLPVEIGEIIAAHLDKKSIYALAQASMSMRSYLQRIYSQKSKETAKNIVTSGAVEKLLVPRKVTAATLPAITELRIGVQHPVLSALAPSIALLPDGKRRAIAAQNFIDALLPLPEHQKTTLAKEFVLQLRCTALADSVSNITDIDAFHALLGSGCANDLRKQTTIKAIPLCSPKIADELRSTQHLPQENTLKKACNIDELLSVIQKLLPSDMLSGKFILTTISDQRTDLQIKPLIALASRLQLLPTVDWHEARISLLAAIDNIPAQDRGSLTKLIDALNGDLNKLRENASVIAVGDGESVRTVAARITLINEKNLKRILEEMSIESRGISAVKNGELACDVVDRDDIEEDSLVYKLNQLAFESAKPSLMKQESVHELCKRYGIRHPDIRYKMEYIAWQLSHREAQSENAYIPAIADKYGITIREFINTYARAAVDGFAGKAVRAGENAADVAKRYGITSVGLIYALEKIAVTGPALDAVKDGLSVTDTAKKFGIHDNSLIRELARVSSIKRDTS